MSTPELYAALAVAQGEFPVIRKDKEVSVRMKTGGTYKFKYAPLETILSAVRPALSKNGLAVTQTVADGLLVSTLSHASGGTVRTEVAILFSSGTAQEYGSALTYARRYSLTLLLGIAADDDEDGNLASGNEVTVTKEPGAASPEFDAWREAIEQADADALADIAGELAKATMPASDKAKLRAAYSMRKHALAQVAA